MNTSDQPSINSQEAQLQPFELQAETSEELLPRTNEPDPSVAPREEIQINNLITTDPERSTEIIEIPALNDSSYTASEPSILDRPITPNNDVSSSLTEHQNHLKEKSPKKNQIKFETSEQDDSDETELCIICYERFTTSGKHRLVSIKCGHVFGKSCIEKWMRNNSINSTNKRFIKAKCPQCNLPSSLIDVRVLYSNKVVCLDNTENVALKIELKSILSQRNEILTENKKLKLKNEFAEFELSRCREEIAKLKSELKEMQKPDSKSYENIKLFEQKKTVVLSVIKNSTRVFAYDKESKEVIASIKIDKRYGLIKFNINKSEFKEIITLHSKDIKSVGLIQFQKKCDFLEKEEFTEDNKKFYIMCCSLDRTAYLIDGCNFSSSGPNDFVLKYEATSSIWSGCYSYKKDRFYLGLGNGGLEELFYNKKVDSTIKKIPKDTGPIYSTEIFDFETIYNRSELKINSIIITTFNAIFLYVLEIYDSTQLSNITPEKNMFLLAEFNEGYNTYSTSVEENTKLILVSLRTSSQTYHVIYSLETVSNSSGLNFSFFKKGTLKWSKNQPYLSKTCIALIQEPSSFQQTILVFASDGITQDIVIWSTKLENNTLSSQDSPSQIIKLNNGIVMDIQFHNNSLMILTDTSFLVYQ